MKDVKVTRKRKSIEPVVKKEKLETSLSMSPARSKSGSGIYKNSLAGEGRFLKIWGKESQKFSPHYTFKKSSFLFFLKILIKIAIFVYANISTTYTEKNMIFQKCGGDVWRKYIPFKPGTGGQLSGTPESKRKQRDIRSFFSAGATDSSTGAAVSEAAVTKKSPVKLRFEGGAAARINSTDELLKKDVAGIKVQD